MVLFCLHLLVTVKVLLSHVQLFATPWTIAPRLLCPWNSPGRILECVAIPFSGDLPDPGIKPRSPAWQTTSLPSEPPGKPLLVTDWVHIVVVRIWRIL